MKLWHVLQHRRTVGAVCQGTARQNRTAALRVRFDGVPGAVAFMGVEVEQWL